MLPRRHQPGLLGPDLAALSGGGPGRQTSWLVGDWNSPLLQLLRLLSPSQPAQEPSQVLAKSNGIGMVSPQRLLINRQCPPLERLGLGQPIGGLQQLGQVVQAGSHIGMVQTGGLFKDLYNAP